MGIFSQRRWRERGLKPVAPAAPQLPPLVSREFHENAIADLTRSYELRLVAAAAEVDELTARVDELSASKGEAKKPAKAASKGEAKS
jgi:hypothetical protein